MSNTNKRSKKTHSSAFSSISNRIFMAVATPVVCTFPHKRHLSHPTQSMIRVTFRKCVLNSSFRIWDYILWLLTISFQENNNFEPWHSLRETKQIRRTFRHFVQWLLPWKLIPRSADRLRGFPLNNSRTPTGMVPIEQPRGAVKPY